MVFLDIFSENKLFPLFRLNSLILMKITPFLTRPHSLVCPRMRLTPDMIEEAAQFVNPLKERELDLRGRKIPVVENLAVTLDQVMKDEVCCFYTCYIRPTP